MFGNIYEIVIKNASNLPFVSYYLSILFQNNAVGRTSAFGVEKGAINVPLNRLNSVYNPALSALSVPKWRLKVLCYTRNLPRQFAIIPVSTKIK